MISGYKEEGRTVEDPGWPKYMSKQPQGTETVLHIVIDRLSSQLVCSLRIPAIIYQQTLVQRVHNNYASNAPEPTHQVLDPLLLQYLKIDLIQQTFSVENFLVLQETLLTSSKHEY